MVIYLWGVDDFDHPFMMELEVAILPQTVGIPISSLILTGDRVL